MKKGELWRVTGLVEKPKPEDAPSHLFIVGRYLLSPKIMDLLATQGPGAGNEIQLTDAMERFAEEEMYALVIDPLKAAIPEPLLHGQPPMPVWHCPTQLR